MIWSGRNVIFSMIDFKYLSGLHHIMDKSTHFEKNQSFSLISIEVAYSDNTVGYYFSLGHRHPWGTV